MATTSRQIQFALKLLVCKTCLSQRRVRFYGMQRTLLTPSFSQQYPPHGIYTNPLSL